MNNPQFDQELRVSRACDTAEGTSVAAAIRAVALAVEALVDEMRETREGR